MNNKLRRVAKVMWWLATPWRIPARLRYRRDRKIHDAQQAEVNKLIDREVQRVGLLAEGCRRALADCSPFDLLDDADVMRRSGLRAEQVFWKTEHPLAISDRWSAARYVIDLLRRRPGLYERFPEALSGGREGAFAKWLADDRGQTDGLSAASLTHVLSIFSDDVGARARQAFLAQDEIRAKLPHGLTPAGQRGLFTWFVWYGIKACDVRLEEIWWLFLEASEQPRRELWRAYLFTPHWQKQFPDALTVFGRESFSKWFVSTFGAAGSWVDVSTWPISHDAAAQLRAGYWAHETWREQHPCGLIDVDAARSLVTWLGTKEPGLTPVARRWCQELDPEEVAHQLVSPGVNVIGHFCYPSGLRVSVESIVEALDVASIATSLRDVRTDVKDDPHHVDFDGLEVYDVTLIHAQPEPLFRDAFRLADLYERVPRAYRIGYWYWEFDSIPESWLEHARDVDEVWAATEFVARGLRNRLPVPVRVMFPGVRLAPFVRRRRSYFGLDGEPFTFLFTFHMMSVMERKNPMGLIRAFCEAFPTEKDVRLVLKTSFGDRHPLEFARLQKAAADSRVTLIDQVYTPDEVLSLMDACDVYVSLHRSEGLGLTIAEAMLMGKPVIATNFSGNVDFMDDTNSLPVRCELVKLGTSIPPYNAELEWAEPSVPHAAQCMQRVYVERAWARDLGRKAKAVAERTLSAEVAGRKMAQRLAEIRSLSSGDCSSKNSANGPL
ncbi:glycosyltransferase family 4 protein [Variovorax sp. RT4R15]|uniref:glycosyltransferase family 4 protein n=1 Tax=Variovorax sp. RT4R15 TaxID=3443737 RepID=UPI003F4825EA